MIEQTQGRCKNLCLEAAPIIDQLQGVIKEYGIANEHGFVNLTLNLDGYAVMRIIDNKTKLELSSLGGGDFTVIIGKFPDDKELCTIPRYKYNMEKEHPAKCQSALTVNHIVPLLNK